MEFTKYKANLASDEIQRAFKHSVYFMNNNYKQMVSSDFYEELSPNLQTKLLQILTEVEKHNFLHLFY
jgi:predicted translin family RNA/ssDNA-binding protein